MSEHNYSIPKLVADWIAGQPFTNVLLTSILASVGWTAYYSVTTAIPAHLQMIQSGYERINQHHREDRTSLMQQHEKWLDRVMSIGHPETTGSAGR